MRTFLVGRLDGEPRNVVRRDSERALAWAIDSPERGHLVTVRVAR